MHEKRKHHYNDQKLQGYLISALIAIELLLVIALLVYLYAEFNRVIDSRFYRIHSGHPASWPEFLSLLTGAVGVFLLVNAVLLFLAHLFWDRYVASTIQRFSSGLERMAELDFSVEEETRPGQHRIIDLLAAWREKERQRNNAIAMLAESLKTLDARSASAQIRADWRRIIDEYRRLLSASNSTTDHP